MEISQANVSPLKVLNQHVTPVLSHNNEIATLSSAKYVSFIWQDFNPFLWKYWINISNLKFWSTSDKYTVSQSKLREAHFGSEKELIISECFCSALFRGSTSWAVKWWCQRSVSVFCRAVYPPCNGFLCKGEVWPFYKLYNTTEMPRWS